MKILVTGAKGQLGLELSGILPERGHEVVSFSRGELDVTDLEAVDDVLDQHAPEAVINASAYTNVDGCETDVETAYLVNALGPCNLAQACERRGVELLHVSTNYVFDGKLDRPYEPFDTPKPISVYGQTKLAGEEYVRDLCSRWYIVRTAGVYGQGHNFVRTMLRVAAERGFLKVKDDEFISPTHARDLAWGVCEVIEGRKYGMYHVVNGGSCSWHEFAAEIFRLSGTEVELVGVPRSEYPLPAARPANGVISDSMSPKLRHWREALADYLRPQGAG